jgi:hypothetical protein
MAFISGKQIAPDTITSVQVDSSVAVTDAGNTFSGTQVFSGDVQVPTVPAGGTSAVNKNYVESVIQGLDWKESVRVATTANLNATRTSNVLTQDDPGGEGDINAVGIDGLSNLAVNDRVLVKDQTLPQDNGIYYVSALGDGDTVPYTLTRATDADLSSEVTSGVATFVEEGTASNNSGWVLTTDNPITLNTTPLLFTQFSGSSTYIWRDGVDQTGNIIDVKVDDSTLTINGGVGSGGVVKVKAAGITATELNTSVAGNGLTGGGGSALAVGAGDGISVAADTVAVNASALTGQGITDDGSNNFTVNLAATSGLSKTAGSGAQLAVVAGDGIDLASPTSNAVNVKVSDFAGAGLEDDGSNNLQIASTAAGAGLLITTPGVIDIVAADSSLTINADDIAVKLDPAGAIDLDGGSAGLEVRTDGSTVGINGSNQLYVPNSGITGTQLNVSVAGAGLAGGGGSALSVNVDRALTIVADSVGINLAATSGLSVASGLTVVADSTSSPSISVNSGGLRAAVPTTADKQLVPTATSGDNADTGLTISNTPAGDGYVSVSINGMMQRVGNGVKTKDCYFTADGGTTARAISAITAGDALYWNGVIAGYDLATSDIVDISYTFLA